MFVDSRGATKKFKKMIYPFMEYFDAYQNHTLFSKSYKSCKLFYKSYKLIIGQNQWLIKKMSTHLKKVVTQKRLWKHFYCLFLGGQQRLAAWTSFIHALHANIYSLAYPIYIIVVKINIYKKSMMVLNTTSQHHR